MQVHPTSIAGLFRIELDLLDDERGSFREAWQAEKMEALGLPALRPVQYNVSESRRGVIRGIHAEPWDKYIHVPYGSVFSAVVDLRRDQPTFGAYESFELDRGTALFVSKGLGNSFQALSELAVYTYLVTDHWRGDNPYPAVAFDDPELAIPWPIQGVEQIVSAKDRANLPLRQAFP